MTPPRILIYHRVADDPIDAQLLCVSPARFDRQLAVLARDYRVVPLARQIAEWRAGTLPNGTVSITFDDGYLDNLSAALPLLEKHRLHATVFVSTGLLGNLAGFWGDVVERILLATPNLPPELRLGQVRLPTADAAQVVAAHDELRRQLRGMPAPDIWNVVSRLGAWAGVAGNGDPPRPVLDAGQLRRLAASPFIEIGAHTVSHTRLSVLPRDAQRAEIADSRQRLEQLIGRPVRLFAYPYGSATDFNDDSRALVAELGFDAGIANVQGDLAADADPFALPRRLVRDWDETVFAAWMKNPDASDAERVSLSQRQGRLLAARQRAERGVPPTATERRSRRIVHINTYIGHGGAANSTLRLCRMQRADGLDARVLAQEVKLDPAVAGEFAETFDPAPDPALADLCRREGLLDLELQGSHRLATHPRIAQADLIHLQNLHGGYFNPLSVSVLSGVRPTVWTLRDMHSLTGHCAHSLSCEGWRDGCKACPDLRCYPPVQKDNCQLLWQLKHLAYRHSCLQIVAPSVWIKTKAEQGLLGGQPVELIYNGVDLDAFRPLDRIEARRRLGLPEQGLLVGTAADYGLANPYKGGQHFVAVARALKARHPEVTFVSIGGKRERPGFSTDGVLEIPYAAGDEAMAAFYSALDFFLYTAIADTCPLVLIEGIACGLPAVAFETGGVPEIARHGQEGLIVPYRDEHALFEAASELISRPEHERQALRRAARRRAEETFDIRDMHRRYLEVYERTVERWHVRPRCRLPIDALPDFLRTDALRVAVAALPDQVVAPPGEASPVGPRTPSAGSSVRPTEAPPAAAQAAGERPPRSATAKQPAAVDLEVALVTLCDRGVQLFEAGLIDEALACFDEARNLGLPYARPHSDRGAILWHLGRHDEAVASFRAGVEHQPDDWNATANLGDALLALDRASDARLAVAAFIDRNPDHQEAAAALVAIDDAIESRTAPNPVVRVAVATSIAPFGIEAQSDAIATWLALGLDVISVNTGGEIRILADRFPQVRFVEATRDGRALAGKPYVFVDDLVAALRNSDASVFGIVNSDVLLRCDGSTLDRMINEARDSLVFGSRVEVGATDATDGALYRRGFDYFFFDRRLAERLPPSEFLLGVPWWDYWVPLAADRAGVPIKRFDERIAFHVTHPVNYSVEMTLTFGEKFRALLGDRHWREVLAALQARYKDAYSAYVLADLVVDRISRRASRLDPTPAPVADRPRVSAIVSTYASAACIAECLDDLIGQTIADRIEIIVIDAASPENEREIVQRYTPRHPAIRYVRTPERIGVYAAWNLAIGMAQGDYLVSCSTNDRLRPDALEILAAALDDDQEAAIAYGNSYLIDRPHQSFSDFVPSGAYIWNTASFENLLKGPNVGPHPMWRRSLHGELGGFDEGFRAIADQDFWLRVARRHRLRRLDDFTGLYLVDPDSLSGNRARAASEIREVHQRHAAPYAFDLWKRPRRFNAALAERIERQLPAPKDRPHYRVWLIDSSGAMDRLAASISALAGQLYPGVEPIVLSAAPCPPSLAGGRIGWRQVASVDQWFSEMAALVSGASPDARVWDVAIPSGARIGENFLLLLAMSIAANPGWRFAFFDDAVVTAGDVETPRFRSRFDLDRARCTNPLGMSFALRGDAWAQVAAALGAPAGAEALDLALCVHDVIAPSAIGHCPEPAWTCPQEHLPPQPLESVAQAILRHLGRQAVPATLLPGPDGDTFRVRYGQGGAPKVSVVLRAGDDASALDGALRSIVELTTYPDFEVIVAAACGANDYVDALRQLDHGQLRVVESARAATAFAIVEAAIEAATGAIVVLFADGCRVVQPEWLDEIVHYFVRPEIGAVGPRLLDSDGLVKDAGRVLGLHGPSGAPDCGFRLEYAGDMDRLRVDRRVSALSPDCLAIRRDAWPALAPACRPAGAEDWSLGLCLALADAGQVLLWTPGSTVLAGGDSFGLEEEDRTRFESAWPDTIEATYARWLPRLAVDPWSSPHLSRFARGCVAEEVPALTWDPAPDAAVPKLFIHLADFAGQGHHRILEPYRLMAERAMVRGGVATRPLLPAEMAAVAPDAWVFQRQTKEVDVLAMQRCRQYGGGAPVIYELDDLITDIPPDSPHYRDFGPDTIRRFLQAIRLADRLVVSTEVLARRFADSAAEVRVRPNALAADRWAGLAPRRRAGVRPRVGWVGSPSHAGDLEVLKSVVPKLAGEVQWVFMGFCPRELKPFAAEIHPWCGLEDYPKRMADLNLDLALAPLAVNAFNEAKSHLKLLEYGILGYPVLCTDIDPYRGGFPVTRLSNQPEAWLKAIREHANDPGASAAAGDALRAYVRSHWMLDDHLDDWLAAWSGR